MNNTIAITGNPRKAKKKRKRNKQRKYIWQSDSYAKKHSSANKKAMQTNNSCQEETLGTLNLYIIWRVAKEFFLHICYHLKKATL